MTAPAPPAEATARTAADRRAGRRTDAITMALATWTLIGLFVDGWAHTALVEGPESFFTPWHALFYSGFAATACWIGVVVMKRQERGLRGRAAIPEGYDLALVGVAIFALGGVGDLVWHTVFGIEEGLEALFSPTHLLLFSGAMLILSTPLRVAWRHDAVRPASLRAFGTTLASATLAVCATAFMLMFAGPFLVDVSPEWIGQLSERDGVRVAAAAAVLIFNAVLLVPTLLLSRRWYLPTGSVAILWGTVAVLGGGIDAYTESMAVAAVLVAGVLVDVLVRRVQASRLGLRQRTWLLGVTIPLVLWTLLYTLNGAIGAGIGQEPAIWTGNILWAAITGGLLAVAIAPPAAGPPGANWSAGADNPPSGTN